MTVLSSQWLPRLAAACVALLLVVALAMALSGGATRRPAPADVPLPRSIAALGDSMTQGVGADPQRFAVAPEYSWATGDQPNDSVLSHYERLLQVNPDIEGNNHNLAVSGAQMADAVRQAEAAVRTNVDYVTILLGANDVCASSRRSMTSEARFEAQFRAALDRLDEGLPEAYVYVLSVPNVYRLWEVLKSDPAATALWEMAGTCRSMLSSRTTDVDRQQARERNAAFNSILESVCSGYPRCQFDDYAVFDFPYTAEYVSSDYFHPSVTGQKTLAEVSWKNGYWPEL